MSRRTPLATALLLALLAPGLAESRPGDLDPRFGIGGMVTTRVGKGGGEVNALASQADGRVIAIGTSDHFTPPMFFDPQFQVVRYLSDGRPDPRFGFLGSVAFQSTTLGVSSDLALDGLVLPDGQVVIAGAPGSHFTRFLVSRAFGLARLTSAGRLDPGFGSGGIVSTSFPGGATGGSASRVKLLDDDMLLAVGLAFDSSRGAGFALARYARDGVLDPVFGDGGVSYTPFPQGDLGGAEDLALLADGHTAVAGLIAHAPEPGSFDRRYSVGIGRYQADGTLDSTLGGGGIVQLDFPGAISAVKFQPDGRVLAIGELPRPRDEHPKRWVLMRYQASGDIDRTFGTDGLVETDPTDDDDVPATAAFDQMGRIVVVGCAACGSPGGRFAVARYQADGSLDASFGNGGIVLTAIGEQARALAVAIQDDGKLVVGGSADVDGSARFALARYLVDDTPATTRRRLLPLRPGSPLTPRFRPLR